MSNANTARTSTARPSTSAAAGSASRPNGAGTTPKAPASPSAPNGAGTGAGTAAATKKKYDTMIVGVGEARKPLRSRLEGLATTLGCRSSDLIWHAVEQLLQNPPKAAPSGSSSSSGTSPGFWVLHTNNAQGKPTGVRVIEVESRNQIAGGDRLFVRYKDDADGKSREKAMGQAVKSAKYDLNLMGIAQEVEVETFDPAVGV